MGTRVAIDVGTTGCTIVSGGLDGGRLRVSEDYRFDPGRRVEDGVERWDLDRLVDEILTGLERAEADRGPIDSVGIDATAAEFGFVADGVPIEDPVRGQSAVPDGVSRRAAFHRTGHRRLPGAFYHATRDRPETVRAADRLLFLPALLAVLLGGRPYAEHSYAVSAGFGNTVDGGWASDLLAEFELPTALLSEVEPVGAAVGSVDPSLGDLDGEPDLVVVPGHDTTAAVAALPFRRGRAFLATGSWFIPGFEVDDPIVTDAAYDLSAENMGGVEGTARFVRNIPGFRALEHCREEWRASGGVHEYDALVAAARDAEPFGPLVDMTDPLLREAHRGRAPIDRIAEYCLKTGQAVPKGEGEVTRCLLESLAAGSALVLEDLAEVADEAVPELRVCGGGVQNEWFCRMLADATGAPVLAGPTEATAIGNILTQLVAAGDLDSIAAGRDLVAASVEVDRYEPEDPESWEGALERLRSLRD